MMYLVSQGPSTLLPRPLYLRRAPDPTLHVGHTLPLERSAAPQLSPVGHCAREGRHACGIQRGVRLLAICTDKLGKKAYKAVRHRLPLDDKLRPINRCGLNPILILIIEQAVYLNIKVGRVLEY